MNNDGGVLSRLEETQAQLRKSIETSRKLVEESDRLIQQHRKDTSGDGSRASASLE